MKTTPGPAQSREVPDAPRSGLALQVRKDLVAGAVGAVLSAAYRSLQQDNPERFSTPPERPLLTRVYAQSHDGWRCPLFKVPASPGSSGEPILLLHGLGLSRHSLDFDRERSLARALAAAGFTVYMAENRADRSAIPPESPKPFDFDDIATADLPAAIEAVQQDSGFERIFVLGHGLGGQLLYAYLAHFGDSELAAAVTMNSAVRFQRPTSGRSAISLARALLPASLRLPTSAAATLLSPGTSSQGELEGDRARGLLVHGTEDISGGMLRQALLWLESGSLVDRDDRLDYAHALSDIRIPLQLITSHGDSLCPPDCALGVRDTWRGPVTHLSLPGSWAHLDLVMGPRAPTELTPLIAAWLDALRRGCWTR
ncbi:MAG: putative alpha/beta hydrolase [Cognaticolwellia sp.]